MVTGGPPMLPCPASPAPLQGRASAIRARPKGWCCVVACLALLVLLAQFGGGVGPTGCATMQQFVGSALHMSQMYGQLGCCASAVSSRPYLERSGHMWLMGLVGPIGEAKQPGPAIKRKTTLNVTSLWPNIDLITQLNSHVLCIQEHSTHMDVAPPLVRTLWSKGYALHMTPTCPEASRPAGG
eukprot:8261353-Alexandrium_andersonii.AAC.1